MRNMFPNNSSELSWLWNNSGLCLVRIHCSSVKQKQWKHQQAALNIPLQLSDRCPQYLKSEGDLSTADGHVTPYSYDSIHTHPGRAPSAPGPAVLCESIIQAQTLPLHEGGACQSLICPRDLFLPEGVFFFFLFFKKGQKTECDDCQLFCGRIKTLSSLSHDARKRHLVLAAPNLFVSIVRFKFWLSAEWLLALFMCQTSR